MTPAFYAWRLRRGDTPRLGLRLHGRNIASQEIAILPRPDDVVSWTITWPSGALTKTTALNGGLSVDPRTGVIDWPITDIDVTGLGSTIAPCVVRLIDGDGRTTTYLTGTIQAEG